MSGSKYAYYMSKMADGCHIKNNKPLYLRNRLNYLVETEHIDVKPIGS